MPDATRTPRNRLPTAIDTFMPLPSFRAWLEHRLQEVPDAMGLALLIAQSGAAGFSREELSAALDIPSEAIEPLLRAMVVAGQVVMLKVNGDIVYRASW